MKSRNEISPDCQESPSRETALQVRPGPVIKPHYESHYSEESWEVTVALPGVEKDDLKVNIENEILDLQGVRRRDVPESFRPLAEYPDERRYRLRLDVGPEVDPEKIEAHLEDGILSLRLPLREEVKPRSIPIH
ncbi:MAG: Hsp20/alpha crystallin family protein [Verrucomicrobiales bacterium]|nr:Hsp20/alpha crystallin family protein [Verrucomicrobiales bacterium]